MIVAFGHGYWGKNIVRNLFNLGVLHGVCETHPEARATVAALYPTIKCFASPSEVWADPTVKAVAISTPAATHADLVMAALHADKDVFVEKPMALNFVEGKKMVEEARRLNRILMVGHLLEYHPAIRVLTEWIQAGKLGDLQYIYSNRLNLGKFRREEDILWSFAPHDIAILLRLIGKKPQEVIATGGAYLRAHLADTTVTNLKFEGGIQAHIFVSWLHPYKEQKLVVVGSKQMVVFDDGKDWAHKLMSYDKGADWVNDEPIPRQGLGEPFPLAEAEPLHLELSHFVRCIETRKTPLTDGESGLRVLEVLQAAEQSLQSSGACIKITL